DKPERAESTVWQVAKYTIAYMVAVSLFMILMPESIMHIFTQEPAAVAYGVDALRIMSFAFAFMAVGMVTVQAFNGAGDTMTPTWINVLCYWVVQVPLAWFLATSLTMGPYGVFWSIFVAEVLMGIVGLAWFMRGSWKLKRV
ncbi:MAG: MATE family efflux transporter, partial [Gammaproteobacteria bacterium]|nr:MATE family efflux transporter [Gammaproteobacteria bacterium]